MDFSKWFLKKANSLISVVMALFLFLASAFAAFSLWDNAQIYAAVDDVQSELLKLKPDVDDRASFAELRAINSDVCAWLSLDNTEVDYPVLQGEDNLTYINTDVYGNFALAGSIFLDSSCDNTFHDAYSLLYGHHMADNKMFGDLDLYVDESFFEKNSTGTLILPDRSYCLEIFACLQVPASDENIFIPQKWQSDNSGLIKYAKENALHYRNNTEDILESDTNPQILAMSTCSSEFTDARTVILAVMEPYSPES